MTADLIFIVQALAILVIPVAVWRVLCLRGAVPLVVVQILVGIADISLEIRRGHSVDLIGPTGAGKTTLVDLILGLFIPTSGRILVAGRDIQDRIRGWQHYRLRSAGRLPDGRHHQGEHGFRITGSGHR